MARSIRRLRVAPPPASACARPEPGAEPAGPAAEWVSCGGSGAEGDPDELIQVGDLAKAAGKTVRAIHLYEEQGLLRPHERSGKGRYRLFGPDALVRVRWIGKLQSLGLSLSQIAALVRGQEGADSAQYAASQLSQVYITKLAETRAKVRELIGLQRELEQSLSYLSNCYSACEPEVSADSCGACERHPEPDAPPDLIAGLHVH